MDNKPTQQKTIESYLLGELSENDRRLFEKEMTQSKSLTAEVQIQKEIMDGIHTFGNQMLKDKLKDIHVRVIDDRNESFTKKPNYIKWVAIAATLALVIFFTFIFFDVNQQMDDVFADHYVRKEISFSKRSGTINETLTNAEGLYQAGDYNAVIVSLQNYLTQDPNNVQVYFALGCAQMQAKQYEDARHSFDRILKRSDPFIRDEICWYAALNHIKLEEIEEAKNLLSQIKAPPLREKADAVLQKLR